MTNGKPNPADKSTSKNAAPVAVITGAGRGIGKAFLEELLKRGYRVVAVVRSLASVRELFSLDPNNVFPLRADVTEASTEEVLKEFLQNQFDKVDLLINNAGYGATAYGIEALQIQELDRVMAVHLHGPIRCVKACLPLLRKSPDATIINISSRFASIEDVSTGAVPPDQATYPYRIAKASLNMLTSCLSIELSKENIRVLSIDPGKVKTRFGPVDADTEPQDAAAAIVDLVEKTNHPGLFLRASGEKVPW